MKTIWVLCAFGIIALVGQGTGEAQPGKSFDLNAKVTSTNPNTPRLGAASVVPSNQTLATNVAELQQLVVSMQKEIAALKAAQAKTNAALDSVNAKIAVPKGYTTQYITKANFQNVEGTALMKFYVRY